MNRKLDASLIALSASGLFLAMALMASSPVDGGHAGAAVPGITPDLATDGDAGTPDQRTGKAARRGLALPYFSFAHGMRRIGG